MCQKSHTEQVNRLLLHSEGDGKQWQAGTPHSRPSASLVEGPSNHCFKFRNKIGTDAALEALRECRRLKKASTDELWAAAKVCRVANIMRPYLESL